MLFILSLIACLPPAGSWDSEPDLDALPPPSGLTVTPADPEPGEVVTLEVTGLAAGQSVVFAVSNSGVGPGPCHRSGICAGILVPIQPLPAVLADAYGVASIDYTLPASFVDEVGFQAWTGADLTNAAAVTVQGIYDPLLAATLKFYGGQRCGDSSNWLIEHNTTAPTCHLQDGQNSGADLTGGWHDAGDHIKFTSTQANAAYVLLKGFEAFGASYGDVDGPDYAGVPNGIPDVLDEVRFATDYLARAHTSQNQLVTRVGDSRDHNVFVTSPFQSTLGASQGGGVRAVQTNVTADVAGMAAAALALMSRLVEPYDPVVAADYESHSVQLYALGQANPGTSNDQYYPGSTYKEELMCAAVELYRLTGDGSYLSDAEGYDQQRGRHYWVGDWENPADYCRHSLVLAGSLGALTRWRNDVDTYNNAVSSNSRVDGVAWFSDWGMLMYASHAAFSAALLYDYTGEDQYRDFALGQLDWITGNNPYNRSFVAGYGNNPPTEPHHANAYGHDTDWNLSRTFVHELTGAMVSGPTISSHGGVTSAGYDDDIEDYIGNEVSISYNAPIAGLAAFGALHQ